MLQGVLLSWPEVLEKHVRLDDWQAHTVLKNVVCNDLFAWVVMVVVVGTSRNAGPSTVWLSDDVKRYDDGYMIN